MSSDKDYDDFFDGVGGGGAPSYKFDRIGSAITGTVVDTLRTTVIKFGTQDKVLYPDGTPIPQLNVTLQTELRNWQDVAKVPTGDDGEPKPGSEDDGTRRVYIKYDMRRAVAEALRAGGERGLAVGGKLQVKKSGEKDVGKGNPLPLFEAKYKAPVDSFSTPAEEAKAVKSPPADDEPPF